MKRLLIALCATMLLLAACEPAQPVESDMPPTAPVTVEAEPAAEAEPPAPQEPPVPSESEAEDEKPEIDATGEGMEIERKWLVDPVDLPANLDSTAYRFEFVQSYINYSPEIRLRSYDGRYYFTLKRDVDDGGLVREEIQFQLTREEYDELLEKQVGNIIYKTRYQFYVDDVYVFVDVYKDNLEGLVVAEVEFDSVEEAESYVPPDWFGKDVTDDKRYKNGRLSRDGMPEPD